jgi:hypothetical protein
VTASSRESDYTPIASCLIISPKNKSKPQ